MFSEGVFPMSLDLIGLTYLAHQIERMHSIRCGGGTGKLLQT